ncbi:MAG: S16 family serine protease [Candidatus Micrarchaeaceae archaeon]
MNIYKLLIVFLLLFSAQSYAYTTHINAPAVLIGIDKGALTNITLNATPGNGTVTVNGGSPDVANNTLQSIQTAIGYATSYLNLKKDSYNFNITIGSNEINVSGPSAGLAFTLLSLSALEQKSLSPNFTVTGTISANGSVGPIGGIFDKVQAARSGDSRFIIAPYVGNTSSEYMLYYLSQQAYGTPVVEVQNVSQAIPYAFGDAHPTGIQYNITTDYHVNSVPNASTVCPSCNGSAFAPLANFTFNFTSHEIGLINGTMFGGVKSQLYGQLAQAEQLSAKGYLYTGADLAFIEYPTAVVFANYNVSGSQAKSIASNISSYCTSINNPPQMTDANYEMVIGAEARVSWAMATLSGVFSELNASQTSDGILLALESAAPAYAWCAAANQMYNISSGMGGNAIESSSNTAENASAGLSAAEKKYGSQFYVSAAKYSLNSSDYGAVLYSLAYANVFYNSSMSQNALNSTPALVSGMLSSARGIWPSLFAMQSYFYLSQANLSTHGSGIYQSYISNARTTAALSIELQGVDAYLQRNFIPFSGTYTGNVSSQLNHMQRQITLLFRAVILEFLVILAVVIWLLVHTRNKRKKRRRR